MSIIKDCIFEPKRYWAPYGSAGPPADWPDVSRYGHDIDDAAGAAAPAWLQRASGLWVKDFDGINDYGEAANADTEAMSLAGGLNDGYTFMCWISWKDTTQSEIILGRYQLDVGGWELYLTENAGVYSLTQRHHHAGTIVDANPRSASFSVGWALETAWHLTVVYQGNGTDCLHYRNGVPLAVTSSTGGIRDFEATTQDLVMGARYTKDANWYWGPIGIPLMFNYIMTPEAINAKYQSQLYL